MMIRSIKLSVLVSLILMSTSASAAMTGHFLLGGTAGYAWRDGYANIADNAFSNVPPRTFIDSTQKKHHLSDHGFLGGVITGYQVKCARLLMGLELAFDWDNADRISPFQLRTGNAPLTTVNYATTLRYKKGLITALTYRAGYKALPWLVPYVRLGLETSRDTLAYNAQAIIPGVNILLQSEDSKRIWRFLAGVGVEVPLFWLFSGRLEYNYTTKGQSIATNAISQDTPVVLASPLQEHHVDTKQEQHTGKFSLVFNFPNIF